MSKSSEVLAKVDASQEKFDYFICGVSGALFAYLGEGYSARHLRLGPELLEPASLLFLAAAFFLGLKRIELIIMYKRASFTILQACEEIDGIQRALKNKKTDDVSTHIGGGSIQTLRDMEEVLQEHIRRKELLEKPMQWAVQFANKVARIRNVFLYLGVLALFASKLFWPPAK